MTDVFEPTPSHRGGSGEPLVCLHGITDTWRTWELILPALERERDVFAPTLAGHAGGPPIEGEVSDTAIVDAAERTMDEAGLEVAHLVGNSLGGYLALRLAARGRARSVVAFAPAGGWPADDASIDEAIAYFRTAQELVKAAAPHAEEIMATEEGRRRATEFLTTNYEHIPAELLAHQLRGAAACTVAGPLLDHSERDGWHLDAKAIECPVRIVWGTEDRILRYPVAATRFREEWLPAAEWIELDAVGHLPQLDVPAEAADLVLGFA